MVVDEARLSLAEKACSGLQVAILPISDLEAEKPLVIAAVTPEASVDLSRPAAVLFTSGTSGRAKGAVLTHGNLWFNAIGSALRLGQRTDDVWMATLPFFHIGRHVDRNSRLHRGPTGHRT